MSTGSMSALPIRTRFLSISPSQPPMSEPEVRERDVMTQPVARLELHRGAGPAGPYGLRAWYGLVVIRTPNVPLAVRPGALFRSRE